MVVLVLRGPVLRGPVLLMRVGPGPVLLMLGTVMALVSLTALLIHE